MPLIKYAFLFLVFFGCNDEHIQKRSEKKWSIEVNPNIKPLPENEVPIFEDDSSTKYLADSVYHLQKR